MAYELNGKDPVQNLKKAIFKGLTVKFDDGEIRFSFNPPNYRIDWKFDGQNGSKTGAFNEVMDTYTQLTGEEYIRILDEKN